MAGAQSGVAGATYTGRVRLRLATKPLVLTVDSEAGQTKTVARLPGRAGDRVVASRRKRAGPSNRTGRGRRTTSANWGGVETKRHAVGGSSKRQNEEGREKKRDTGEQNQILVPGCLLPGCMNQTFSLAHSRQNEPSSLGESSPQKGVHHRRSRCTDAPLHQNCTRHTPAAQNPRRRSWREKAAV